MGVDSMTLLEELKTLLDIPLDDTSRDDKLQLQLKIAVEIAAEWFRNYACEPLAIDVNGEYIIPSTIMIGIAKFVEACDVQAGVKSESIGGMSVSYGGASGGVNATGTPLDEFYAYLEMFRCRHIRFIPVRKNGYERYH